MVKYENLSGRSNVEFFEIHNHYIDVVFYNCGFVYRYSCVRPGKAIVDHLKELATNGLGLNSYISRFVKKNYDTRIPLCNYGFNN